MDFLKKRTILEKILVLYILLTVVIFIYMAVNFHAKTPLANQLKSNRSDLCLTAVCVRNAANILRKIDNAVDPCYDFYKFACGRFTREETIPEEAMEVSPFTEIGQRIELQFKSFLETDYKNDPHYVELMKTIYKTCMNSTQIEINGLRRIKRIFAEAGGWPMMLQPNQWNARNFNWKSLVYFFKKKGLPHDMFFSLYVNNDYVNTTLKKIMLGKPWVDSEFFSGGFNNTQIQQYYDYMVDVGATFGVNRQKAQIEMKQVLEFIINLAKIMVVHDKVNLTSKYHPMTIRELQKEFATIPWLQYVNVMLAPVDSISWDDVVIVQYPKFLSDLENLLFKTQKQILANYMYWSAFEYEIPFLTKDLNNIQFEYRRKLFGVGQKLPRWQNCVRQSMRLNLAAGLIFTTNFFNDKSIRAVTNLVEDVKLAFLDTVRSNNWMDKKTKRHAITKAERLTAFVEYPQDLKNEEVDEYYKSLTLTTNDFLEIDLNLTIFEHHKSVEELRQSKSKNDWKSLAAFSRSLSVSYNRQQNTLKIRPAVLQDPFYDSDRPQYMNYGALGYWIGHEITHGFDNSGRQYDKDGNLIDWWEPISNQTFNKKAQCIVEQFRNYSIPEINVNLDAEKTKSENIADNAGIRIAYNAYQKFLAKNGEEPSLPGLPYTPKQMFWISAATNFCTKYRKEWLTQVLRIYPNPPNYLRVVLPFMNSRFFAKDYQCPLLSPMNPKYKCQVW